MAQVKSKDGTLISFDRAGSGPAIILVDGGMCSRELGPMKSVIPFLSEHHTVFSYDRRGRGESGDSNEYSVQKEVDDIEALIKEAGGTAMLFGISSGAALVCHCIEKGLNVSRAALYEPPFHIDPAGEAIHSKHITELRRLINADQRGEAVSYFLKQVVGIPGIITLIMRFTPMWKKLKALAPTLNYDLQVLGNGCVPTKQLSKIALPVLVIAGEKTPVFLRDSSKAVSEALPQGQLALLPGQTHNVSAKALAPVLQDFFQQPGESK